MPLIDKVGREYISKNIEKEVKSGKPVKQAAAIAYSVDRKAKSKKSVKKKKK